MITLLIHLYAHYVLILATGLAENDRKLRDTLNTAEPLKSLYTRLNECVDYATEAGDPVT